MYTRSKRQSGFTLIEVMIVVVIIGVLLTLALPSYRATIIRSTRSDAQAVLIGFAQAIEKHYSENFTYLGAADAGGDTGAPAATVFSSQAPLDGSPSYNLTIQAAAVGSYTLRATPIADGGQDGDGFLEINELGVRAWDRDDSGTIDSDERTWER